jgi:hypothetical protein
MKEFFLVSVLKKNARIFFGLLGSLSLSMTVFGPLRADLFGWEETMIKGNENREFFVTLVERCGICEYFRQFVGWWQE